MTGFVECANSIFEQPVWLDIVAPGQWDEAIVRDGDKIVARMPYILKKDAIVMPPFTQTFGPWITYEYRSFRQGNGHLKLQKEIISALLAQLPKHRYFNMTFDSSNDYVLPYRWYGFSFAPMFSYRLSDLTNMDAVYSNLGKNVTRYIKRASNMLQIVESTDPEKMIALQDLTFKAQGRRNPKNKEKEFNMMKRAIEVGIGKILLGEDSNGKSYSGAFLLYDKNVCYYLAGGSDPELRSSGSQSFVLWNAILFAKTVSSKFDFEGSMIEGIEAFFKRFGGTQVINYVVSKNSLFKDILLVCKPRIKKILGYKH